VSLSALAHTGRMVGIVLTVFLLELIPAAVGQARITLTTRQYKARQEIRAAVENTDTRSVTYCAEFGQWSPKGTEIEITPSPFCSYASLSGLCSCSCFMAKRG
jgi:hypothetical protein